MNPECLMEDKLTSLSRRYQASLKRHLDQGKQAAPQSADRLGREALDMGLETLDLARIHEQALALLMSPDRLSETKNGKIRRGQTFFAKAHTRIERTHSIAMETNERLSEVNETLRQRTGELAAMNRELKKEVARHRTVEKTLGKSEQNHRRMLKESLHIQEQLRHLSRKILSVQEDERKRISRDLHDEVAQVLTGINLYLTTLKQEATAGTKDLKRKIARTQQLVERSLDTVQQFSGRLRPLALDDLGLVPALRAHVKDFAKLTGLNIRMTSFTENRIEQLGTEKRTVLYRVAQEALTNVARHAHASQVTVSIVKHRGVIRMDVKDDGRSFKVNGVRPTGKQTRLGLVGMRERVQMMGGHLTIESAPDEGTTIRAEIPLANRT